MLSRTNLDGDRPPRERGISDPRVKPDYFCPPTPFTYHRLVFLL